MFTGIVQAKAHVLRIDRNPFGVCLVIDRSGWTPLGGYQPAPGDSICVSGVCLTIAESPKSQVPGPELGRPTGDSGYGTRDAWLPFDVIAETLAVTTLGSLKVGDEVNIEPAVLPTQPMGGHFVQGHVDGVGTVTAVKDAPEEYRITIAPPAALLDYLAPKGSITIDGVSLTLAALGDDTFDVALIPTTLDLTTLASLKPGDRVNLEADILSKQIVHYLRRLRQGGGVAKSKGEPITMATLQAAGFC